jgi:hypothetical protein
MKTLLAFLVAAFVAGAQAATIDFAVTTPQPVAATSVTSPAMGGGSYTRNLYVVTATVKVAGNAQTGTVTYWQVSPTKWLGWGGAIDANGIPPVVTFNLPGAGTFKVVAQFNESGPAGTRTAGPVAVSAPVTIVAK